MSMNPERWREGGAEKLHLRTGVWHHRRHKVVS